MSLHQHIKDSIKEAMKAKDPVKLQVLRSIVAASTNELLNLKRTPQDMLTDEETITVIKRAIKQRKDSIEQFVNGGRSDLADSEKEELSVLQTFVPASMSKEDIKIAVEKKIQELGITDKSKIGMLLGAIMKDLKGQADGSDVKEVVESLLQ
jgi:uncharacterized protein YqeY